VVLKVTDRITSRERIYLPEILRGLRITASHLLANLRRPSQLRTYAYPEVKKPLAPRVRARHRLVLNEEGRERCVACCCCVTACPAHCITVVAREGSGGKEKEPAVFTIDILRCVFCGLCVEACPRDAIRMDTGAIALAGYEREAFRLEKEVLMAALPREGIGRPGAAPGRRRRSVSSSDLASATRGEQAAGDPWPAGSSASGARSTAGTALGTGGRS